MMILLGVIVAVLLILVVGELFLQFYLNIIIDITRTSVYYYYCQLVHNKNHLQLEYLIVILYIFNVHKKCIFHKKGQHTNT